MAGTTGGSAGRAGSRNAAEDPRYKWLALSNTTLGMLMATINSSIVLIALPDIFRGIEINPLSASNISYLLWMIMGFLVVTAVLVVAFGRMGDMFGRVRMYNIGFAIFTASSILLAVTWMSGSTAALWLIGWRIVQGVGGAFLMANSTAILTDAFPKNQRGLALGINGVAAISGSFIGLVLGGVLGPLDWHYVFLVSVPFGAFGTVWAYLKLRDTGIRQRAPMDWWGNLTFAIGLIAVLVGITYGIQPYGGHLMGWTNPKVYGSIAGGVLVLVIFTIIETRVANPLFQLHLFRIRAYTAGNLANLMGALARGGLQFILIIWLQGIWLPQHGYSFEQTPLWAGIYMLPLTIGFLLSAPTSGVISDKLTNPRWFTAGGLLVVAASFVLMIFLPVNFHYWAFASLLFLNGVGSGLFASPNRAEVMNSLPANQRGAGAGMSTTFQNAAMVLSIGMVFSMVVAGLSRNLPSTMYHGLVAEHVPGSAAHGVAALPPISVLFAAFLGYNPMRTVLGPVLGHLPHSAATYLTGRAFFPHLIAGPFQDGLALVFGFSIAVTAVGIVASLLTGTGRAIAPAGNAEPVHEPIGEELAAVAAGTASTAPSELVRPPVAFHPDEDEFAVEPSISGTVRMRDGSVVNSAIVTVTGPRGDQVGRTPVDDTGFYALVDVPPGGYTVVVAAPQFQPAAASVLVREEGPGHRDFVLTPDDN